MIRSPLVSSLLAIAVLAMALTGCKHTPTPREVQSSDIHYDLGIQAQQAGRMQEAYVEFDEALRLNPKNAQAQHAMALVLHHAFGRQPEALLHFRRALELDPQFTEARVNLGNLYLAQAKYDEAAKLYVEALNDMRYRTPEFAEGNLGWAEYKRGNVEKGVGHIKAAVTLNPGFCLGYRNLGTIYEEQGEHPAACDQFGRYREQCPEAADAYYREGLCLAKLGRAQEAAGRFAECEAKAPSGDLKDDCRRFGGELK